MEITDIKEATEQNSEITYQRVRDLVMSLLEQEISAQQVSEALVYIAVEMSLQIATNKLRVIPILMQSMVSAAQDHENHVCELDEGEPNSYPSESIATIH